MLCSVQCHLPSDVRAHLVVQVEHIADKERSRSRSSCPGSSRSRLCPRLLLLAPPPAASSTRFGRRAGQPGHRPKPARLVTIVVTSSPRPSVEQQQRCRELIVSNRGNHRFPFFPLVAVSVRPTTTSTYFRFNLRCTQRTLAQQHTFQRCSSGMPPHPEITGNTSTTGLTFLYGSRIP